MSTTALSLTAGGGVDLCTAHNTNTINYSILYCNEQEIFDIAKFAPFLSGPDSQLNRSIFCLPSMKGAITALPIDSRMGWSSLEWTGVDLPWWVHSRREKPNGKKSSGNGWLLSTRTCYPFADNQSPLLIHLSWPVQHRLASFITILSKNITSSNTDHDIRVASRTEGQQPFQTKHES